MLKRWTRSKQDSNERKSPSIAAWLIKVSWWPLWLIVTLIVALLAKFSDGTPTAGVIWKSILLFVGLCALTCFGYPKRHHNAEQRKRAKAKKARERQGV